MKQHRSNFHDIRDAIYGRVREPEHDDSEPQAAYREHGAPVFSSASNKAKSRRESNERDPEGRPIYSKSGGRIRRAAGGSIGGGDRDDDLPRRRGVVRGE